MRIKFIKGQSAEIHQCRHLFGAEAALSSTAVGKKKEKMSQESMNISEKTKRSQFLDGADLGD